MNKPQFLFGSNLIWYGLIFLFLYVTLSVLRDLSFWNTLGWRSLKPDNTGHTRSPWVYFSADAGWRFLWRWLVRRYTPRKYADPRVAEERQSALLLMCMAVVVAPLVEETVFRGYLYPLFAKSFGIVPTVMVTGTLFGLMHGSQLGWSWGIGAAGAGGHDFHVCPGVLGDGAGQLSVTSWLQLGDRGYHHPQHLPPSGSPRLPPNLH